MRRLLHFLSGYQKECILAPLFKCLEACFDLLVPLVTADIIDTGIANQDVSYVMIMCVVLIVLALVGLTCSIVAQYFAARAAVGFSGRLRQALFARIQGLSYTQLDTQGAPTLITRMTSDINQVQNGVNPGLFHRLENRFDLCRGNSPAGRGGTGNFVPHHAPVQKGAGRTGPSAVHCPGKSHRGAGDSGVQQGTGSAGSV